MAWYRRWPFIAGVIVIAITNAFALGSAAHNRSGTPDSTLVLTQRELPRPFDGWEIGENSGLALRLAWRTVEADEPHSSGTVMWIGGQTAWLNEAKVRELGLKMRRRWPNDEYSISSSVPADVLLVLEMNGPAWLGERNRVCALARKSQTEEAEKRCRKEEHDESRLFVVDAGLDRDALRRKYPNTRMYAIVHGEIAASTTASENGESRVGGHIRALAIDEIQVPVSLRTPLGGAETRDGSYRGRLATPFNATVAFGRRLEPWIVALSAAAGEEQP